MKKLFFIIVGFLIVVTIFIFIKPFYSVPVLNYHSINVEPFRKDTPKVSPQIFAKQMGFIHKMGLRVISLDEYVDSLKSGKKIKNALVLTFDDGYDDNYFYALPVLKKYGFPAAIFIIEKHIGASDGFLSLEQIKEMKKNKITFGSHTINHVYLPAIKNEQELKKEISGSKKLLERKLSIPIDYFSYPVGGYNERVIELVKQAGYKAALTSNRGEGKFNQNIFALKRIKISGKENSFIFWLKISGYFNLFAKSVKPD